MIPLPIKQLSSWMKVSLYGLLLTGLYYSTFIQMRRRWRLPEYNYCYLIPFVVLYLIWDRRDRFAAIPPEHSWKGLIPLGFGLLFFWLGELGAEYFTLYLSSWLVLIGICWMHLGWKKLKTIGFALSFILTMFPLPYFLNTKLMVNLRLISSKLGTAMIQLFGLPVTRNGNVIDLGFVQLQVVEACSGLNSLISLVVLSLLIAYFFKAHLWKRCVVVISSVPLAIFTNSLRIAITAVLHRYFGPEIAQGFFHEFSGLVIFLICVPILLIETKILDKLPPNERRSSSNASDDESQFSESTTDQKEKKVSHNLAIFQPVFVLAVILLGATLVLSRGIEFSEKIPVNKSMAQFPMEIGDWKASSRVKIEQKFLDILDLSEYVVLDYKNPDGKKVNFYVSYYESQSKGKAMHTPDSCLPGTGWTFDQSGTVSIPALPGNQDKMQISRAVIQYGSYRQISYYWFSMRGRILNNAYQVKIYNFWDALTMQRTDGALVRLITPVHENERLADAEARLQDFLRVALPVLEDYIPGEELAESS
jgi:exosortase D (VPLPA-CTERM-specific)